MYEEHQERHRAELAEKDAALDQLRAAVESKAQTASEEGEIHELRAEKERLSRQIQLVREEYEAKIERLNARVRELSESQADPSQTPPPAEPERRGFFRK